MTARERKVLELVQDAVLSVSDEDLHHKTTRGLVAAGARYVAVKLLTENAGERAAHSRAILALERELNRVKKGRA